MRALRLLLPTAVLVAGIVASSTVSFGKAEYSKKEKKGCPVCHVAAGKKDLNATGKCYAEHSHSLEKCAVAEKK